MNIKEALYKWNKVIEWSECQPWDMITTKEWKFYLTY